MSTEEDLEKETWRKVDETLRQVREMLEEDLIKPEKAKKLRLESIKQLRSTTTNVKTSIKTLKKYVQDGILPEEDFEEAKDLLVDVVADPEYQDRIAKVETISKVKQRVAEAQEGKMSREGEFKKLMKNDEAFSQSVLSYKETVRQLAVRQAEAAGYADEESDLDSKLHYCGNFCWPFRGQNRCGPWSFGDLTPKEQRSGTSVSWVWLVLPPFFVLMIFLVPLWIAQGIGKCRMKSRRNLLQTELVRANADIARMNAEIDRLKNSDLIGWNDILDDLIKADTLARNIDGV